MPVMDENNDTSTNAGSAALNESNDSVAPGNVSNVDEEGSGSENDSVCDAEEEARILAAKTPVSLLLEVMLLKDRDLKPIFKDIDRTGPSHDPVFEVQCLGGRFSATASAKSKKDAKHKAAKSVLLQMFEQEPEEWRMHRVKRTEYLTFIQNLMPSLDADNNPEPQEQLEVNGVSLGSTAAVQQMEQNFVGKLHELCQQKKYPSPIYDTVSESGPPHERTFVMEAKLADYSAQATSKTKKLAKRAAAQALLVIISGLTIEQHAELSTEEPGENQAEQDSETASSSNQPADISTDGLASQLAQVVLNGTGAAGASGDNVPSAPAGGDPKTKKALADLTNADLDNESPTAKHKALLTKLGRQMEWKVTLEVTEETDDGISARASVKCGNADDDTLEVFAYESNNDKAKFAAAHSLLRKIKEKHCL